MCDSVLYGGGAGLISTHSSRPPRQKKESAKAKNAKAAETQKLADGKKEDITLDKLTVTAGVTKASSKPLWEKSSKEDSILDDTMSIQIEALFKPRRPKQLAVGLKRISAAPLGLPSDQIVYFAGGDERLSLSLSNKKHVLPSDGEYEFYLIGGDPNMKTPVLKVLGRAELRFSVGLFFCCGMKICFPKNPPCYGTVQQRKLFVVVLP